MRCEDAIKELASPTDARNSVFLSDHLNHCESCAAWAKRAARLDHLWHVTQPAEPTSGLWDNLWVQVVSSLHAQKANDLVSSTQANLRNGSANSSMSHSEAKLRQCAFSRPFSSRRWSAIGVISLAQAAAVLLMVSMSWRLFGPSRPHPPQKTTLAASLASIDIEEGQVVMIVADAKLPAVIDLTPNATMDGVGQVDWYGDEKYFDWFLVYHEVESLAKPTVAMKE